MSLGAKRARGRQKIIRIRSWRNGRGGNHIPSDTR